MTTSSNSSGASTSPRSPRSSTPRWRRPRRRSRATRTSSRRSFVPSGITARKRRSPTASAARECPSSGRSSRSRGSDSRASRSARSAASPSSTSSPRPRTSSRADQHLLQAHGGALPEEGHHHHHQPRLRRVAQLYGVPSQGARDRKTMCGMRDGLVECRTKLVNTVRGWVRAEARRLPSGDIHTRPMRIRETVKTRPAFVDRLLSSIEELTVRIGQADQEVSSLAKADATCQRLMTVPGVGPVTEMRFSATVDDVARFSSAHQLESYLGLVPSEHSSGDRKHVTSITKAGSSQMRWVLVQACWVARRWFKADPMVRWAQEVEKRKGKKVAIIALARKMSGIMYAIWRDGSTHRRRDRRGPCRSHPRGGSSQDLAPTNFGRAPEGHGDLANSSCPEAVTAARTERPARRVGRRTVTSCNRLRPVNGQQPMRLKSANSRLRQLAVGHARRPVARTLLTATLLQLGNGENHA